MNKAKKCWNGKIENKDLHENVTMNNKNKQSNSQNKNENVITHFWYYSKYDIKI